MYITGNVASSNIIRSYTKGVLNQRKSIRNISSGIELHAGKDNPHGLRKSEELRMKIRGLEYSQRNIQDSIGIIQTAEANLNSIGENLNSIKELLIQVGSPSTSNDELEMIQKQIDELTSGIKGYIDVDFNGSKMLNNPGGNQTKEVIIGGDSHETIGMPLKNISHIGNNLDAIDVVANTASLDTYLDTVDKSLREINTARSEFASVQNTLQNKMNTNDTYQLINESAQDILIGSDIAMEMTNIVKEEIMSSVRMNMMKQTDELTQNMYNIINR